MIRRAITTLLAATLAASGTAPGQSAPGQLVKIAPRAWAWIASIDGSSNSALFVGDSAAVIVDPGVNPAVARAFLAAAGEVTDRPIRYAVLTHWHPDHALGVTCLANRGFTVLAHGATGRALAERGAQVAKAFAARAANSADKDELAGCRALPPDSIVTDRRELDVGGRHIEVFHPGPAHTPGDLIVWDPAEKVLATGDVLMHRASPDMSEASPLEWATVLDSLVGLEPSAVVAGHFGPSHPADLTRFRDYLRALIGEVKAELAAGTPPEQVPGRVRMAAFGDFAQYPQFGATFAGNAARIVAALRGGAPDR
jgi:glyoxylase-like metal-dependent hydrolase (beta-lactamase superfamily II)